MHALQNFAFDDHLVRVVLRDGEPWFVLADVCRVQFRARPNPQYPGQAQPAYRSGVGADSLPPTAGAAATGQPGSMLTGRG